MNSQSLKPKISVVIPTYNRASLLYHSLSSLVRQTIPKSEFEVIVINDGSKDNTHEVCQSFEKKLNIKWFSIKNSGISTAKNIGLFASKAEIVFFFDDDDVAHKNLLSEHIKTHKKFPEESTVVLGNTKWSSRLKITYIMEYVMNISGELFYYKGMQHEDELDYTFFWGGRSSCKRSFLLNNGIFNQVFKIGF
jgi:glycosyltransferase involved in cell wall biosynthesis